MTQVDQMLTLDGASGPVAVQFRRLPVKTEAGGRHRYPYPDFGSDLIDALHRQWPFCERLGPPWRRRNACRNCSAPLSDSTSRDALTFRMQLADVPAFELALTLPVFRCESCGVIQIGRDRDLDFHVSEAMVRAFESGHVKPG